jgi:hypothetical protein
VISWRASELLFAALLIATLSLKVLVIRTQPGSEQREATVKTQIAGFLTRHGFQPDPAASIGVSAHSGECQLLVTEVAYQGWLRDSIRRSAAPEDQLLFFFRGRMYPDQPVWLTRVSGQWASLLQNLGLNAPSDPVLGIVASPACKLDALPWQELAGDVAAVH